MIHLVSGNSLNYLIAGAKAAGDVNWSELKGHLAKHDWLDTASIAAQDVLAIMASTMPTVFPQANVAAAVIKLATSMVDSAPGSGQEFDLKTWLKAVTAAEGVDWKELAKAIEGDNAFLAGSLVALDLERIAAPFIPPPYGIAAGAALTALVFIGEHGKPADPSEPVMKAREGDGQVM